MATVHRTVPLAIVLIACGAGGTGAPVDASTVDTRGDQVSIPDVFAPDATAATTHDAGGVDDGGDASDPVAVDGATVDGRVLSHYATRVVSFEPGDGAGFGQGRLPGVVLGPPAGRGDLNGSTDVVSLGAGGRICLAFDDVAIVDGPGTDFTVFENPFRPAGTRDTFDELGEVSVSDDGTTFATFACDTVHGPPYVTCAGQEPVYANPVTNAIPPDDARVSGGDPFDLAQLPESVRPARVRIVCIRDLRTRAIAPPSTGFDLDAIAANHHDP